MESTLIIIRRMISLMTSGEITINHKIIFLTHKSHRVTEIVRRINGPSVNFNTNQIIGVLHVRSSNARSHMHRNRSLTVSSGLRFNGQIASRKARTTKFDAIHKHSKTSTHGHNMSDGGVDIHSDIEGGTIVHGLSLRRRHVGDGGSGPLAGKLSGVPSSLRSSAVNMVSPEGALIDGCLSHNYSVRR